MNKNGHFRVIVRHCWPSTLGIVRHRSEQITGQIGSNMKLSAATWRLTKGGPLSSERRRKLLGSPPPRATMRALAKLQTAHSEEVDDECEQALKDLHLAQLQEAARRHHL